MTSDTERNEEKETDGILAEQNIILKIPKGTCRLDVTAYIPQIKDEKIATAFKEFNQDEIFEMRRDFLDNLLDDDYDARYALTEEGKKYLDELEQNRYGK